VIIPDFGAFLKKDKAATSLENSVTFSPFLRFNDGLVEDYVMEKENITKEAVVEEIRKFVQEIKGVISQKKPYIVENFGAFYEDDRGGAQFLYGETEEEVQRKFEEKRRQEEVATPKLKDPIVEMEVPAMPTVAEVNDKEADEDGQEEEEPVVVKPAKKSKKKAEVVEEVEVEEVEPEEVIKVTKGKRGRVQVEDVKEEKSKDSSVTTTINITVNAEKEKKEDVVNEKAKQLENATSSLQSWMDEVNKRRESEVDKKIPEVKVSIVREEVEKKEAEEDPLKLAKERKEEELKRAAEALLTRQKEEEEQKQREAAMRVQNGGEAEVSIPAGVWNDEDLDDERKESPRGVLWLLLGVVVIMFASGALWFWEDISEYFGWGEPEVVVVEHVEEEPVTLSVTYVPEVSTQQDGMFYVVTGSFSHQENAMEFAQILHRLGYDPEIVVTRDRMIAVCIAKGRTEELLVGARDEYAAKYGSVWILR
jgi:chemotaxis protein histidine kinase CheA